MSIDSHEKNQKKINDLNKKYIVASPGDLSVVEKHIKQKLRCNTHLVSDDRKIYIFSNENKIKKINKSDLKKILNININDISIKFIREIPKSENRKTSYSGLMKLINNEKIL
jgi:hypothetical protein